MSENKNDEIVVNIDEWIDKAKADPSAYLERQATEIFLTTLGTTEPYCGRFFLKGGLLMGIVYGSPRQTADIDYSTNLEPDSEVAGDLREKLDKAFPRVAASLGYPDIVCKVQTLKLRPRPAMFKDANAPGFDVTIGYAIRGTNQEERLLQGSAALVLKTDISFKEPVGAIQIVRLGESGNTISAYSLTDVISEKFRALLQQEDRNRYRRQDIYDLQLLISKFSFDGDERQEIFRIFLEKCAARQITPHQESLEADEIVKRSKSEWDTLKLEIDELPDFDICFSEVNAFYKSLPWNSGEE